MPRKIVYPFALAAILITPLLLIVAFAPASTARGQVEEAQPRQSCDPPGVDPLSFSHPTRIDNRWFPLTPGVQTVLEGTSNQGQGPVTHRIVATVIDLTKEINGVRTLVLLEEDFSAGLLIEAELAFFAQDNRGNVWKLGQYPELFENGASLDAPDAWISGVDGAEGGILAPGQPRVGLRFLQGIAPAIGFLDCGEVVLTGQAVCIRVSRCYQDVIVIDENSPLSRGVQRKFYAPDTGNIKVEAVEDPEAETLELLSVQRLDVGALTAARARALALEVNAYKVSPAYRTTPPMGPLPVEP